MKIIDKNDKELLMGSRVQTGTTASPTSFYPATITDIYNEELEIFVTLLYDNGAVDSFPCWETLTGSYQFEEGELIDG